MGDNLHAPTIPSGPTTARQVNGNNQSLSFTELQRKKDALEAELSALGSVLDSHNVDMNTSLLTPDGYPRADIDVAQIRTTRSRIIHLRNDYKDLMKVVEKFLHDHFASLSDETNDETSATAAAATNGSNSNGPNGDILPDFVPEVLAPPFARVNSVIDNSPASQAGLQAGDQIRRFGYVDHANHENLRRVGECVQGNEGHVILVKVSRSTGSGLEELSLNLTPRRDWGGRGLLGCHILPV